MAFNRNITISDIIQNVFQERSDSLDDFAEIIFDLASYLTQNLDTAETNELKTWLQENLLPYLSKQNLNLSFNALNDFIKTLSVQNPHGKEATFEESSLEDTKFDNANWEVLIKIIEALKTSELITRNTITEKMLIKGAALVRAKLDRYGRSLAKLLVHLYIENKGQAPSHYDEEARFIQDAAITAAELKYKSEKNRRSIESLEEIDEELRGNLTHSDWTEQVHDVKGKRFLTSDDQEAKHKQHLKTEESIRRLSLETSVLERQSEEFQELEKELNKDTHEASNVNAQQNQTSKYDHLWKSEPTPVSVAKKAFLIFRDYHAPLVLSILHFDYLQRLLTIHSRRHPDHLAKAKELADEFERYLLPPTDRRAKKWDPAVAKNYLELETQQIRSRPDYNPTGSFARRSGLIFQEIEAEKSRQTAVPVPPPRTSREGTGSGSSFAFSLFQENTAPSTSSTTTPSSSPTLNGNRSSSG